MSKSPLISIEAGELSQQQFKRKGRMNVTFDELGDELRSLARSVLDAFGPIAQMQMELMRRQQALEDHLGFVYVPVLPEDAPPAIEPAHEPAIEVAS